MNFFELVKRLQLRARTRNTQETGAPMSPYGKGKSNYSNTGYLKSFKSQILITKL